MHKNLKFIVFPEFYIVLFVLILVTFRFLLNFTFSFVFLSVISRKIAICAVPNNYEPCLIKQEDAVPHNYKPCLIKQEDAMPNNYKPCLIITSRVNKARGCRA